MSTRDLPRGDSPDIHLAVATPAELRSQWNVNASEWRGPLSLEAYLRREEFLINQSLTEDAGLTPWMLVYQPDANGSRRVLCGCETLRKRALVARDGGEEEVICHGVASVFCAAENRGKGYAGRMIHELAQKARGWQAGKMQVSFSILFSDIGKDFYAVRGWHPFPSAHISLGPSTSAPNGLPQVKLLTAADIPSLCAQDEELLRRRLLASRASSKTRVAVIPDARTIQWHQAREDFFAKELFGKQAESKGGMVDCGPGRRVWCYWQRNWAKAEVDDGNKLYILRMVIEDDEAEDFAPASHEGVAAARDGDTALAVAALFAAAQAEASQWTLSRVECWNPSSVSVAAVQHIDSDARVEHRDTSSITSLQWYGEGMWSDVDWVCNERFGWC